MESSEKSGIVRSVFDTIYGSYDDANDRISLGLQRRWKRELVKAVSGCAGSDGSVLDVCCGTGDIALAVAAKSPKARVTGLDFSPAMLSVAKEKGAGVSNVTWLEGNAMELPFEDGSFSASAISFGLRNTPDYSAVLSEMVRVVKPGGYVFCLDSFVPDSPLILPFYKLYFSKIMPLIGGGKRYRKEYQWLCKSTRDFLRKGQLSELFAKVGLSDVSCRSFLFGACVLHMGRKP